MIKDHDADGLQQKYYPIDQAATYLGVSHDTLKRWESKGMITPYWSPSNQRMYTLDQLDEAMKQHRTV